MKKESGKKITLEDLSTDIKGLGESLGNRINVIEVAMGNLEGAVSSLEVTVNSLDGKMSGLESKMNGLDGKVSGLEGTVVGLEVTVDNLAIAVARGFENVDKRFERLEGNFDQFKDETEDNFKKVRNDILEIGDKFVPWNHFDAMSNRLSQLEHKPKNSK